MKSWNGDEGDTTFVSWLSEESTWENIRVDKSIAGTLVLLNELLRNDGWHAKQEPRAEKEGAAPLFTSMFGSRLTMGNYLGGFNTQ